MKFLLFVGASCAWAQVGGPMLGLVPDGSAVRAMYGLPAAGMVGGAIPSGALRNIAISPAQNYALATAADGSTVMVFPAPSPTLPVPGAAASAGAIVVSPQGSAAASWLATNSKFQVLPPGTLLALQMGLSGGTPIYPEIDVTAFGAPISFAVSDDGSVAGIWADGVRLFSPSGSVTPISIGERAVAIAFFAGNDNLAIATPTRILSVAGGNVSTLYQVSGPRGGSDGPVGIAASGNNRWIVTAARSGEVIVIDTSTGAASKVDCECSPDGVFPIGGSVFRLTDATHGVKLVDASSGAVLIVPNGAAQ